uniref:threonine ammonia-lyase n=1 Tax=Mesorhizobium sp. WSM4875 TaxID=3038539 RepID=UPI002416A801|nr:threonine/serine dehydratase [Mesorhizobium sp. WSM4875]WIE94617.1 threonine/serine dehydratase [Mesorhizobium sp. WSM4875]
MAGDLSDWYQGILAAESRVASHTVSTPLLESESLNASLGLRLLVKPESLQKTGSFKARGALNFVLQTSPPDDGLFVGYSSGNHAQGLAYAAGAVGKKAHLLMPPGAPSRRIEGTRALGAEVEVLTDFIGRRDRRISEMVAEGAVFVPPFDHCHIIHGQGTVGLELARDAAGRDMKLDVAFIPTSGGGLLAGTGIAVRHQFPACQIVGVEPTGFDDFARSIAAGSPVANEQGATTLCDGLMSPRPGTLPFQLAAELQPDFTTVSDSDVRQAIGVLFANFNLVVEPSGAAGLAAVLKAAKSLQDKTVAVVVSGGNIDAGLFARILDGGDVSAIASRKGR